LVNSLKHAHGRYASYWNATRQSAGHVWQGRYYSCPLDDSHLWEALRYTELNPVRAGLIESAEGWAWSSAAAHCSEQNHPSWLDFKAWADHWKPAGWREFLEAGQEQSAIRAIRISTYQRTPGVPSVPMSL
jgi:putative transposase